MNIIILFELFYLKLLFLVLEIFEYIVICSFFDILFCFWVMIRYFILLICDIDNI